MQSPLALALEQCCGDQVKFKAHYYKRVVTLPPERMAKSGRVPSKQSIASAVPVHELFAHEVYFFAGGDDKDCLFCSFTPVKNAIKLLANPYVDNQ
jgi:hypothetical protein